MSTRPTRHSYSSISTWEECAARYAYSYIYKLPEPDPGPAAMRGTRLHKDAEDYLNNKTDEVAAPYELRKIAKNLWDMKNQGALAEAVFLVDRDWKPVEDQSQAFVKGIIDAHYFEGPVLHVRDFKSGREYPTHRSQLELYSVLGLLKYPHAERAESAAIYIDGGYQGQDGSIIPAMLPSLIDKWTTKIVAIEADNDFIANPGSACKWCPFKKSMGGPCGESAKAGM